jgi:hypothetical protein
MYGLEEWELEKNNFYSKNIFLLEISQYEVD